MKVKANIRENITCNKENLKKYLPECYSCMVGKLLYSKTVTLISFNSDHHVITSNNVIKVQKKLKSDILTLYFAYNFTLEATEIIHKSGGIAFYIQDFPWTDERYHEITNKL